MKKLELKQMEEIQGGDFLDGACAVFGATGTALAVRALVAPVIAVPLWGQVAFAAGAVACLGRGMKIW